MQPRERPALSVPSPWPPDFPAWIRSAYPGAPRGTGTFFVAREAWNAAIAAVLAELEYQGAGEDPDGDRVRAVEQLRAE
jgi:hypothetical protein